MSDYSTAMESLAYENATPLDVAPPPLRGDVWLLGLKYSLPKGTHTLYFIILRHPSLAVLEGMVAL